MICAEILRPSRVDSFKVVTEKKINDNACGGEFGVD